MPRYLVPSEGCAGLRDTTLIITCWRRPDYLTRALASWAAVPEIGELGAIIIAMGRGMENDLYRVIGESGLPNYAILPDSDRAATVHGEHTVIGEAIQVAFGNPGTKRVICACEDALVSDDILRCYSAALSLYPGAFLVNGHNDLGQGWSANTDDTWADQSVIRAGTAFNPWCCLIPRDSWEKVIGPAWDWDATSGDAPDERGWDWNLSRIAKDQVTLTPDASRAMNIGEHDGVYANPELYPQTVARSFREHRGHVTYRLEPQLGLPGHRRHPGPGRGRAAPAAMPPDTCPDPRRRDTAHRRQRRRRYGVAQLRGTPRPGLRSRAGAGDHLRHPPRRRACCGGDVRRRVRRPRDPARTR